ncbi:substrate-binding domain-containing protein, partial [Cognatilysobacter segetis]
MKLARLAALSLALAVAVSACSGGGSNSDKTPSAAAPATATDAKHAEITGAGATFIYPLLSKWSAEYAQKTGSKINYQSIGSGGGIAQIKAGT